MNNKAKNNEAEVQKDIERLKYYFSIYGNNLKEIANETPYPVSYLKKLIQVAIKQGKWFSEEEEKSIIERIDKERKQKQEERRTLQKERTKLADTSKKANKQNEREHLLYREYKKCRNEARREDRLEIDGKENVSTESRKRFIRMVAIVQSYGVRIAEDDIKIILNAYNMHTDIATTQGIKALIFDANQKEGIFAAERRINELINTLKDTKFCKPLLQYKIYVGRLKLLPIIRQMKNEGLDISIIAKKLGISIIEANTILNSNDMSNFLGPDDMDI